MSLTIALKQSLSRQFFSSPVSGSTALQSFVRGMAGHPFRAIDFALLKDKVMKKSVLLVDVRESAEIKDDGKILNSVNIPLGRVSEAFGLPDDQFRSQYGVAKPTPSSDDFVLSCRSGKRATAACETLNALGYRNTLVYSGSFLDWVKNEGPLE